MPVPFEKIEDKQRIVIIDNEGSTEILNIAAHVLEANQRKFDWWKANGENSISPDAPVILIQANDHLEQSTHKAKFLEYQHHIMVIHHVREHIPPAYDSFENYLAQYEEMADKTPKGGSILFNQADHVANLIAGEREREDTKLIEYGQEPGLSSHVSAAKAILRRIGINEELFQKGIVTYEPLQD